MKEVTVRLSEARIAAVEAPVNAGEFESVGQVFETALDELLNHDEGPDIDQLERDIDEIEERERRGETGMSAADALRGILAELRG